MHTVTILRESAVFGPYDEAHAIAYFREGKILLNDLARVDGGKDEMSFAAAARRCGWKLPSAMNPWTVVRKIGFDLLLPFQTILTDRVLKLRTCAIALVGLAPLAALLLNFSLFIYIALALYVSVLWGFFFWSQFKTDSSSVRHGVVSFVTTAFLSTTLLLLLHSTGLLDSFDGLTKSPSAPQRLFGFFCVAGVPEEICKASVIFWLVRRPGRILKPQDVVLYGLLSGLGFGIHEGLSYQLFINRNLGNADATYVTNVLRLTSLPFLHACWCGIASYFIAHAMIAPMSRYGLFVLAILIPAVMHAGYDAFSDSAAGIALAVFSVVLMMAYLAGAKNLRNKLL